MAVTVEVTSDLTRGFARARMNTRRGAELGVEAIQRDVYKFAMRSTAFSDKTGDLRRSIRLGYVGSRPGTGAYGFVYAGGSSFGAQATVLEYGQRKHNSFEITNLGPLGRRGLHSYMGTAVLRAYQNGALLKAAGNVRNRLGRG